MAPPSLSLRLEKKYFVVRLTAHHHGCNRSNHQQRDASTQAHALTTFQRRQPLQPMGLAGGGVTGTSATADILLSNVRGSAETWRWVDYWGAPHHVDQISRAFVHLFHRMVRCALDRIWRTSIPLRTPAMDLRISSSTAPCRAHHAWHAALPRRPQRVTSRPVSPAR